MTTMRRWMAVVGGVAVMAAGLAGPLMGQEDADAEGAMKVGCLAGRPLPRCKSFWIVELQATTPIAQSTRPVRDWWGDVIPREAFETQVSWNLGHMVNVSDEWAVGGLFTVGSGADGPLTGVRIRARRWLLDELSVELEGGLMRANALSYYHTSITGLTAGARINVNDHGSFFLQWDGLDVPPTVVEGEWGRNDPGGWQNGLLVGASLGSKPALVGTVVLTAGLALMMGAMSGGT